MYYDINVLNVHELSTLPLKKSFFKKEKDGKIKPSLRFYRWLIVISIQLLFFFSFFIDIQILEGTLNASRFLGFHMVDIFTTLEVFMATFEIPINLLIGTATIAFFYLLFGGRVFCSWVCPYGLLSDISESLHEKLVKKAFIKERVFDHKIRYIFFLAFLLLSFLSGYIVFEAINPIGYISRAIIYGMSLGLIWVFLIFLMDIFYAKRAWCKYICPVGTCYSFLGFISATKVQWNNKCDNCHACLKVCPEPHVLSFNKDEKEKYILSGDCTMCGRCIDICHKNALKYDFRLAKLL